MGEMLRELSGLERRLRAKEVLATGINSRHFKKHFDHYDEAGERP